MRKPRSVGGFLLLLGCRSAPPAPERLPGRRLGSGIPCPPAKETACRVEAAAGNARLTVRLIPGADHGL